MKKISWPYFETEEEQKANLGSMSEPDDSDMSIDMYSNVYDTMVPDKSVMEEGQEPSYGYGEGMFSPVADKDYDDVYLISNASRSYKMLDRLKEGASILDIESSHNDSELLSKSGFNVVSICQDKKRIAQSTDYELIKDDARYYNFSRKFDAFRCLKILKSDMDYEILIKNIYNHLRPRSFGVIRTSNLDLKILKLLKNNNFKINKISKFKNAGSIFSDIFVEKNDLDKFANIEIYSINDKNLCPVTGGSVEDNYISAMFFGSDFNFSSAESLKEFEKDPFKYIEPIAKFSCDVAKTFYEKVAGLQVYPSLNSEAGLVFEYEEPQDVLYHMGTVPYSIDIIFIDSSMRIKKISRSIEPGSLATFGCHNVKYVLEISGGLSNRLGIKEGSLINIQKDESNIINSISKFSNLYNIGNKNVIFNSKNKSFKYGDYNIITFDKFSTPLKKIGAEKRTSDVHNSVKNLHRKNPRVDVFDIDRELFSDNSFVRLYRARAATKDDKAVHRGFDNKAFYIEKNEDGDNIYIDIKLSNIIDNEALKKISSNYCILSSPEKSFKGFANIDKKMLSNIISLSSKEGSKSVFVTRASGNTDILRDIICNKIKMHSSANILKNCDIMQIPNNFSSEDIIKSASKKYLTKNIHLNNYNIKNAGFPIAKEVRGKAADAEKMLESAQKTCQKLRESFQKNLSEYEKIQAKPDAVKASKGEYRLSSKRLIKKVRSMLLNIRDSIRVLNDIKDVSTTGEIIDALISSCSPASESAQEIFNLVDKIESPEFFAALQENSSNFDQSAEDLSSSMGRARDYINNNILGIVLISE